MTRNLLKSINVICRREIQKQENILLPDEEDISYYMKNLNNSIIDSQISKPSLVVGTSFHLNEVAQGECNSL